MIKLKNKTKQNNILIIIFILKFLFSKVITLVKLQYIKNQQINIIKKLLISLEKNFSKYIYKYYMNSIQYSKKNPK